MVIKVKKGERDQSCRLGGCWAHLPSSKQQLLLKSTWGQAEQLFCNQGCKERSTRSPVGRENDVVGTSTLSRDTGEEGTPQAQGSSLGSEGFQPHIGQPSPGIQHWKTSPLAGLKPSGAYQRAVRNWASALEEHTDLLVPKVWRQHTENCQGLWPH